MNLKDNRERGKWILNIFYVTMVFYPIIIISDLMEFNLLQSEIFSVEEGEANDLRQGVVGVIELLLLIIAAVFFIMWFRRAYYNLHALGLRLQFTEGWAAGAWFVPILNLFRPYNIMEEIWEKTQIQINTNVQEPKTLIGIWWGLWVVGGILDRVSAKMILNSSTIETYQQSSFIILICDGFNLISLVCIIFILRKITVWEDIMYNQTFEMPIEDHLI